MTEQKKTKADLTNELLERVIDHLEEIADLLKHPQWVRTAAHMSETEEPEFIEQSGPNMPDPENVEGMPDEPPRTSEERALWQIQQEYAEKGIAIDERVAQIVYIARGTGLTALVGPDGKVAADHEVLRLWTNRYGQQVQT